ncbi:MAG: glycosyltransferase family 39 protein [Fimbriimonadales bacterium]|nr:glycosyltransferase family 39 protein [Fimbriimonadales bacterium]
MSHRKFWVIALVIFAVALGARLAIALSLRPWTPSYEQLYVYGDPRVFHEIATDIAVRGELSEASRWRIAVFAPGYPLFLSFVYRVLGVNIPAAVFLNCLLSALSCLLMMILVKVAIGERAGIVAGGLLALHPHSIRFAPLLYSETLFIFLAVCMLLALALGLRHQETRGAWLWWVLVASLFAAAAVPTRIGMLYFAPIVGLLWYLLTSSSWRLGLARWGVFIALFAVWLSPWAIYNKIHYGTFRLSASGEYNLLALFVASGLASDEEASRSIARQLVQEAQNRAQQEGKRTPFEAAPYYLAVASEKIVENPSRYLRASVEGFFHFWFRATMLGSGERDEAIRQDLKTRIYIYYSWVFQLLLFAAWVAGLLFWRQFPRVWVGLATVSVLYFSLVLGNAAYSRFFLQALPYVIPLASLCWAGWLQAVLQRLSSSGGCQLPRER